ncbi:isochorismatase family protein [Pararhizobium sp. LjRoot235]|uniref:isochorismatase family protein n=1 Tax=Pararhizobium sp. LjRoot235 TaxID=3342291 RepID=UPI003ECFB3B1
MPGIPQIEEYRMPDQSRWPASRVDWQIDPKRVVLLIHDMQRFFLRPIPTPYPKDALIKNAAAVQRNCRAAGVPIIFTTQPGSMTPTQRGLLKAFWGPGMEATADDRQVIDELAPEQRDMISTKWRYSAFYNSSILEEIRRQGRDQIIICGVYAHIGILITAVEAFSHDIETFVVGDAVADFSLDRHLAALEYGANCCAKIVAADEVLS